MDKGNGRDPVKLFDGNSPEASEFHRLLMTVQSTTNTKNSSNCRSFLITSATRGEGKSVIAACLAIAFAKFDSGRTLLIDADMRRSTIHSFFQLKRKLGLADILSAMQQQYPGEISDFSLSGLSAAKTELRDCLRNSPLENLKVLTSGSEQANPADIIKKKEIRALLSDLGRSFDNIVIDSPPTIPVTDPLILGFEADATLLVIMAGRTPREVALRARDLLINGQVNLVGVVVNDVKSTLPYYYNYKYYKYYTVAQQVAG